MRAPASPPASEPPARAVLAQPIRSTLESLESRTPLAASAVESKTVREVLPPWHVLHARMEQRTAEVLATPDAEPGALYALALQEAANATWRPSDDSVDAPPSSGVRVSETGIAAPLLRRGTPANAVVSVAADEGLAGGADPGSPLSFKVYTLAELERRSEAPVAMRSSRASFDSTAARTTAQWQRVGTALRAFVNAALAWVRTKELRPRITIALRGPFDDLGDELQKGVELVDWKKLGVTTGIVVGATLTLLFTVLTVAELTDDLKPPGSAAHLASTETSPRPAVDVHGVAPATNMAAMGVQPVGAPSIPVAIVTAVAVAPEAAPASAGGAIVIGDLDSPAGADDGATGAAKKAPSRKAKPKAAKLSFRNPDAVFHP